MTSIMLNIDWSSVGIALTILSAVASLTWWLSGQFSTIRSLIYERLGVVERTILEKLEYHEKHDDMRFNGIQNDIWDIRVRNAAKDGLAPLAVRHKND